MGDLGEVNLAVGSQIRSSFPSLPPGGVAGQSLGSASNDGAGFLPSFVQCGAGQGVWRAISGSVNVEGGARARVLLRMGVRPR